MAIKAFNQLFTEPRDALTDEGMVEEMYKSMIGRHPFHILNQGASTLNIYGEPEAEPVYDRTVVMPIQVKLDPEVEDLNKYGYDRIRDAIVWFARKILRDENVEPKVGDRLDFTYRSATNQVVNEHLIIHEISPWDFQRQQTHFYQVTAACDRTQYLYQPNPPGAPTTPKLLPEDEKCLR